MFSCSLNLNTLLKEISEHLCLAINDKTLMDFKWLRKAAFSPYHKTCKVLHPQKKDTLPILGSVSEIRKDFRK